MNLEAVRLWESLLRKQKGESSVSLKGFAMKPTTGAVAPRERHDLLPVHGEIDAVQDVGLRVEGVQIGVPSIQGLSFFFVAETFSDGSLPHC